MFIIGLLIASLVGLLFVPSVLARSPSKENDVEGPIVGIDLGTTYSCVGIFKDGDVDIIANDQGNRITPSYVAFTENGERLVGDAAKNQATINPANTIFDVKRLIGRKFSDKTVQSDMKHLPYKLTPGTGGKPFVQVNQGGKDTRFAPEEISAMVLQKMKATAEAYLGQEVKRAIITVPAYFNNAQKVRRLSLLTVSMKSMLTAYVSMTNSSTQNRHVDTYISQKSANSIIYFTPWILFLRNTGSDQGCR